VEHVEGAEGTEESVKMSGELAQESWIGWEDYCVLKGVEGLMRNKEVAMLDRRGWSRVFTPSIRQW